MKLRRFLFVVSLLFVWACGHPKTPSASIRQIVGAQKYEDIRRALAHAFPQASVTDAVVDAAIQMMAASRAKQTGVKGLASVLPSHDRHFVEKGQPLYKVSATHDRDLAKAPSDAAMQSKFTRMVPMVRVTLPQALRGKDAKIATPIGDVLLESDHLVGALDLVAAKYEKQLGYKPERVDLVTPARFEHMRFAAISLYLGYKQKKDTAPSFFILEGGTVGGSPKTLYLSADMKPILDTNSAYEPTPYAAKANDYTISLTMSGDDPDRVVIKSRAQGQSAPYITVTAAFQRDKSFDASVPAEITAEAALRVALIGKTMGVSSTLPFETVLADIAKSSAVKWEAIPRMAK